MLNVGNRQSNKNSALGVTEEKRMRRNTLNESIMSVPAITLIYVILAELSTKPLHTRAGVLVDPVNAGGVVGALVVPAVVHVDLTVFAREAVLTDTVVVVGPVHTVLHPALLRPAAGPQTLVDVDLTVLTFET